MRLEPRVQLRPMDFSGGIGALEAAAGNKSRPPDGAVVAIAAFETAGARPAAFVLRSQAGTLAASGQMCSWHAGRMQGQPGACLGRGGWRVMVLGPASGKFGGQTGEGLCGSKDRPADCPAFPGRRTDRRLPRSLGAVAVSPEGRGEAVDGRGRRPRAWRDATSRSSGPYAGPWAGRAGGSGA